ncbi:MAG: ABC transporter permease [Thermoguttaceae bacterium]|nr:ABC transporter permease [Thermoguttaceae bacterium]
MLFAIQTLQLGVKSLFLHPLRSLLTVLGIFIGVASVIWLLAIGEGISKKAQEQIENLGADNIIVRSVKPPNEVLNQGSQGRGMQIPEYGLTRADFARLSETIPTIIAAIPVRGLRETFQKGRRKVDGRLVGCTPEYIDVARLTLFEGRFINDNDNREAQDYCVLGSKTAELLFPYEEPIGQLVRIGQNYNFRVIGIMKERAPSAGIGGSFAAQDYAYDIYIPLNTLRTRVGDTVVVRRTGSMEGETVQLSQITLKIDKSEHVMESSELIKMTLQDYHKYEDYGVTVPLELLEQAKTTRMMFNVFMGMIAGISLVVGGIGIMNIMLATVTERTREIGIRRALGAKRGDIVRQFLIETVVLSVVGGGLGVIVGLTCRPVTMLMMAAIKKANPNLIMSLPAIVREIEPIIVYWSIPLAFFISVVIGVVFGLYPAVRAAKMDPIEALRHE